MRLRDRGSVRAWPRAWTWAVVATYVLWGLGYIERTSVLLGDTRVFLLWDDAMVSMRYARNLVSGHGLVWNPGGERVLGISNLGVTLLMTPAHVLASPEHAALFVQLLALCTAAGILVAVDDVASTLTQGSRSARIAAVVMVALASPLAVWALQGSDVPFVALVLLLAYRAAVRAWTRDREIPRAAYVLLALGVVLRHDTLVLGAPILVAGTFVDRGRKAFEGLVIVVATLAVLVGWTWATYGDPMPNTYYLKATGTPTRLVLAAGLRDVAAHLSALSPALVLALSIGIVSFGRRDRAVLLGASLVTTGAVYDAWVGGDWLSTHPSRFIVPTLPELVVVGVAIGHRALGWVPHARRSRPPLALALVALGVWRLNPDGPRAEWWSVDAPTMLRAKNVENARFGLWLKQRTSTDAVIALHWAGTPAYFAERPAVDVLGKCDRHIAKLVVDRFVPAHSKWDWDYVLDAARPDVFQHVSRGLATHPRFAATYARTTREGWSFWLRSTSGAKLIR